MNRDRFFASIEERLSVLATRLNSRGKLNLLNLHGHSEDFYQRLLSEIFGWNLRNLNEVVHNVEAIDLIDDGNKLIVQVSATSTKQKIEASLSKESMKEFSSYTFKFVSIAKDADELRVKDFKNPFGIGFNPLTDILDKTSLLKRIKSLEIGHLAKICDFVTSELALEVDPLKLESNLATLINLLSKEDWNGTDPSSIPKSFEIQKKIDHNKLVAARTIINDYMVHHGRVDRIYSDFDSQGSNKSASVLGAIRQEYLKAMNEFTDDELFFQILAKLESRILGSSNYSGLPIEELQLGINIVVVDAFIRCKIFENPLKA